MINPYSALFLLFPERADSRTTSAFLISRKNYTAKELCEFVKKIGETISSFNHENHQFLLDKRNRSNFYNLLKEYDGKQDYPKIADTFLASMSYVDDVSIESSEKSITFSIAGSPVSHDIFCEAALRVLDIPDNSYALIASFGIIGSSVNVKVVKNGEDNEVSLEAIEPDVHAVYEWISTHRKPVRVYIPNPQKHGTEGKGAQNANKKDSVGVLLCSDEKAEELMHHALGLSNGAKKLFVYDFDQKKYMQFNKGSGNIDNNYHGWHLNSVHDIIIHNKDRKIIELADKFKKIEERYRSRKC